MKVKPSWIISGLLLLIAGIAAFLRFFSPKLNRVALVATEAAHKPKIIELQNKLEVLKQGNTASDKEIAATKALLEEKKAKLEKTYKKVDLSTDEVIARLERLKF